MQKKTATHTAWHPIFMAARDSMSRMVSRIVPPKEIEDIVQETYVRICQMDKHETVEQPKSFLMKTARNLAFDHLKKDISKDEVLSIQEESSDEMKDDETLTIEKTLEELNQDPDEEEVIKDEQIEEEIIKEDSK